MKNVISIDVEDWFHILNCQATPDIGQWRGLESRIEPDLERLLALLDETHTRVTFFWLGWCAQQYKSLLRRCHAAGHEIGCHTYAHRICRTIGPLAFRNEIRAARLMLEDAIGAAVTTFRSPGLATNNCGCAARCFQIIREAGYICDSSLWCRGPVGMTQDEQLGVYTIETAAGPLLEVPVSTMTMGGRALMPLGGGHLRVLPSWLIRRRISQLHREGRPFVLYIHPRDLDPEGPCLPLNRWRRFKFSVNRKTAAQKIAWLCSTYTVSTIHELAALGERTPVPAHRQQEDRDLGAAYQGQEGIQEISAPHGPRDRPQQTRSSGHLHPRPASV